MEDIIELVIKSYGIAGIIMLSPFIAVVYQWRDNKDLRAQISTLQNSRVEDAKKCSACPMADKLNDKLNVLQEARIKDAQQIGTKLIEVMSEQSALNQQTNSALEQLGNVLSVQSAAAQKLITAGE